MELAGLEPATSWVRLFGWRAERLETVVGPYLSLAGAGALEVGVVEQDLVEVPCIAVATERARQLDAEVIVEPARARPAGAACSSRPPAHLSRCGIPKATGNRR